MMLKRDDNLDFTNAAMASLYSAVDDSNVRGNEDASLIYTQLEKMKAERKIFTADEITES